MSNMSRAAMKLPVSQLSNYFWVFKIESMYKMVVIPQTVLYYGYILTALLHVNSALAGTEIVSFFTELCQKSFKLDIELFKICWFLNYLVLQSLDGVGFS